MIVPGFEITLSQAKERIAILQNFVKEMMVQNVDYGFIPKSDKPSLFKPGAEKLCDIFGFSKQIEILNRIEDWDKGLFSYDAKVILTSKRTGLIEAEGIGSCNSREKKYKALDSFSITNTILKMAKKRALIDAVLSVIRSSGIFTQDIEDYDEEPSSGPHPPLRNSSNKKSPSDTSKGCGSNSSSAKLINKIQQNTIFSIIAQNKLSIENIKSLTENRYNVTESKLLSYGHAGDFIKLLKAYIVI